MATASSASFANAKFTPQQRFHPLPLPLPSKEVPFPNMYTERWNDYELIIDRLEEALDAVRAVVVCLEIEVKKERDDWQNERSFLLDQIAKLKHTNDVPSWKQCPKQSWNDTRPPQKSLLNVTITTVTNSSKWVFVLHIFF